MRRAARHALPVALGLVPAVARAADGMQTYRFQPTQSLSTLGLVYTLGMVTLFLWVGWWSKRRVSTTDDYYTAGRGIGALSNGLAMTSNYMSLATFLGFTALLWKLQFLLVAFVMSWLGGFVLISVSVAPSLRRWGKFTSMQFIGERYGSTAKIISVLCMILLAQLYLVGQMKGIGNVFQVMFHWDYTTGLVVGGIVVTLYVTIGGMYGLSYNQTLQAVIMGIALLLPTSIILWKLNAGPGAVFPPFGYTKLVPEMVAALPTYFDPFTTVSGKIPVSFKYYTGIVLSLAMGTIGLPHIAMRYFTAPSVKEGKKATLWGIFFIGLVFFTTFAIGFAAKLYTTKVLNAQGLAIDPKEADLLVVIMSQAFTPAWVAALPIAGALAAGLSTVGGLLMVIGTGIGHDIYTTLFPGADDRRKMKMGLFFTAFGGVVTILLALRPPEFLLTSVIWAYVVSASTFTPVLILGIWWKGANRAGAIAGMVVGGLLSVVLWWTKGQLFGLQLVQLGPLGHLVAAIFTASAAWFVTIVVSLVTGGEKDERILREVDRIHGWLDYDPARYNGKLFPVACAALALVLMVWSAIPTSAPPKTARSPAPAATVARR
ncbi:solute symporter family protein [Deferrisoma camini]|uniref:solute symporter family protein n=1 Tax=Deferrisoma camini TaxID=1035120 RepID=UPI00046D660C|nr:cation acetate symporter [Deferrisoma camini]